MVREKIISGDLDNGTGVEGRRNTDKKQQDEEEKLTATPSESVETSSKDTKKIRSQKKGFERLTFDKNSDSDIFS
ncbi:MAG: hypothetical protein U9N40_01985 [Euryarchaeota archaeon]|nr:hypothetical protein [Euryarchaeota archaeon]